jgi:hypothetical protein
MTTTRRYEVKRRGEAREAVITGVDVRKAVHIGRLHVFLVHHPAAITTPHSKLRSAGACANIRPSGQQLLALTFVNPGTSVRPLTYNILPFTTSFLLQHLSSYNILPLTTSFHLQHPTIPYQERYIRNCGALTKEQRQHPTTCQGRKLKLTNAGGAGVK